MSFIKKFFTKDPIEQARKHVEKALEEIEEDYPDYASQEYEKAASLFLEAERIDFAVKYFREAASASLMDDDHIRAAEMKKLASESLVMDSRFDEAGGLYSEASDHYFREKKIVDSLQSIGLAIMGYLAARNFSTAVNLSKKGDKRKSTTSKKSSVYDLARLCASVLCEGEELSEKQIGKIQKSVKVNECVQPLVDFVTKSVGIAIQTEVSIEWAGQEQYEVNAKIPLEFELRYKCPVPVRVIDYRFSLSNSLTFTKEPEIGKAIRDTESWLMVVNPVLSGDGTIGPFMLTLAGDEVLVNKHSNKVDFRIKRAPAELELKMTPERLTCDLGDEVVFDVAVSNVGAGPGDNISVITEVSDGLEISLGGSEKTIQFLGTGETMNIQVYVRSTGFGDELVTVKVRDPASGKELHTSSIVKVG